MGYWLDSIDLDAGAAKIPSLWKSNFTDRSADELSLLRDKYNWYYQGNPYKHGKSWLLKNGKNSEAVGTAGIGYRKLKVKGRSVLTGLAADFSVNKSHRSLWPAIILMRKVYEQVGNGVEVVYGLPNELAVVPMKRVGFHLMGYMVRYAMMLNAENYLKKYVSNNLLVSTLSKPFNTILRARSMGRRTGLLAGHATTNIENFDIGFDNLSEAMSDRFAILCDRSSQFLDWRYRQCPTRHYKTFCLKDPGKSLLGYIIYYLAGGDRIFIADMAFKNDQVLDILLAMFVVEMRNKKMSLISLGFFGSSDIKRKLVDFGFRPRQERRAIVLTAGDDKGLLSIMKNEENWYMTSGDEDNN